MEDPETIDLEAQREELEAVLRSEHFTRAPMLARLLSYLCEGLFAGEAGQIKEYTVGVEVFHRGASFDQNSDSIVRVEANRLRKRLAEYYAAAGASHRLRIVIPLGQYVPEFKLAPPPGVGGPASADLLAASPRVKPGFHLSGRQSWALAAALALLLLGLGAALLLFRPLKPAPTAAGSSSSRRCAASPRRRA